MLAKQIETSSKCETSQCFDLEQGELFWEGVSLSWEFHAWLGSPRLSLDNVELKRACAADNVGSCLRRRIFR